MKILLTGANGYIGLRLLPSLLESGHHVIALVRDRDRFPAAQFQPFLDDGRLSLIEGDMLDPAQLPVPPLEIEAAYYLLHSMGAGRGFEER
ncbi:MAG TPA: NAD(P)H-binding protein, partial [Luteolibacter sp.]|nr:NAD(P)H-binding protein [Luteolibacter sp.]